MPEEHTEEMLDVEGAHGAVLLSIPCQFQAP